MFVLTESGGFLNLANYDQVVIAVTEPEDTPEGVANLASRRAVIAQKVAVDSEGSVSVLKSVIADDLDRDAAQAIMRAVFEGMKKRVAVLDLQAFVFGRKQSANGTKVAADVKAADDG